MALATARGAYEEAQAAENAALVKVNAALAALAEA